jgi:hypothetical protein
MQRLHIGKRFGSVNLLATTTFVNRTVKGAVVEEEGVEAGTEVEDEVEGVVEVEVEEIAVKREAAMNRMRTRSRERRRRTLL